MKYEPFSTLQPSNSHAKSKVKTLYLNLLAYILTYYSQTYILISHVSFLELRKIEPYGMIQWWQKILPTSKIKVFWKKGQIKAASSLVFPSHSTAIDFFLLNPKKQSIKSCSCLFGVMHWHSVKLQNQYWRSGKCFWKNSTKELQNCTKARQVKL